MIINGKDNYLEMYKIEMKCEHLQILETYAMYENLPIFEMAKFETKLSGLKYPLWFDEAGDTRTVKHNVPRLKVMIGTEMIPISIEDKPKILLKGVQLSKAERVFKEKEQREVFKYIKKHKGLILKHWNGEIGTGEFFDLLRKESQ